MKSEQATAENRFSDVCVCVCVCLGGESKHSCPAGGVDCWCQCAVRSAIIDDDDTSRAVTRARGSSSSSGEERKYACGSERTSPHESRTGPLGELEKPVHTVHSVFRSPLACPRCVSPQSVFWCVSQVA